jgi:hypothetical protein
MTRLQRLQARLHDIRTRGGVGGIHYSAGTPYLVYTLSDPDAATTRMFRTVAAKQKPVPA